MNFSKSELFKNLRTSIYIQIFLRFGIVLLMYNISRLFFFFFNKDYLGELSTSELITIFKGGFNFDLAAIIYTNLLVILLSIIPFRFKYNRLYQKLVHVIFIVINSIFLLANQVDIVYSRFTLKRTTLNVFKEFGNNDNIFQVFMNSIIDFWPVTLSTITLILIFIFCSRKIKFANNPISNLWIFYIVQTLLFVLFAAFSVAGIRGGFKHSTRPITLSNASKYIKDSKQRPLVLNTPFALIRTARVKPLKKLNFFKSEKINEYYSAIHYNNSNELKINNKNVVIIILESFAKAHIGYLNKHIPNYQSFTPFLDSICEKSYVFTKAYANGRKSIDALPSVIASIPSIKEPFVLSYYSGNKINSIASILNKNNYYTAFFHGAPNGSMGFDAFAKQAGFQDYYGKDEYNNNSDFDGIWGIWDEPFLQYYSKKMSEFKEPFMTAFFSLSSHHPFKVPKEYSKILPEGSLPIHKCIGYTDQALKKFFKESAQKKWFNNTIFVITADHSSQNKIDEYNTSAGAFAIPLIIYSPGTNLIGENNIDNIQQIDVMPTVLNMLNIQDKYIAFGTDAFNKRKQHFSFNYIEGIYQIIKDNYLLCFDGKKSISLFNLTNDRLQKNNILDVNIKKAKELELYIKCIYQEYSNRLIDNKLTIK